LRVPVLPTPKFNRHLIDTFHALSVRASSLMGPPSSWFVQPGRWSSSLLCVLPAWLNGTGFREWVDGNEACCSYLCMPTHDRSYPSHHPLIPSPNNHIPARSTYAKLRRPCPAGSVEEFAGLMEGQMDLVKEAHNLTRLANNFKGSYIPIPSPAVPMHARAHTHLIPMYTRTCARIHYTSIDPHAHSYTRTQACVYIHTRTHLKFAPPVSITDSDCACEYPGPIELMLIHQMPQGTRRFRFLASSSPHTTCWLRRLRKASFCRGWVDMYPSLNRPLAEPPVT